MFKFSVQISIVLIALNGRKYFSFISSYFETSCSNGEGVEKMFTDLLESVVAKKKLLERVVKPELWICLNSYLLLALMNMTLSSH